MAANKVVRNDQAHRLFASFNIMKGRNEYTAPIELIPNLGSFWQQLEALRMGAYCPERSFEIIT